LLCIVVIRVTEARNPKSEDGGSTDLQKTRQYSKAKTNGSQPGRAKLMQKQLLQQRSQSWKNSCNVVRRRRRRRRTQKLEFL
jgi:hypothetical protein